MALRIELRSGRRFGPGAGANKPNLPYETAEQPTAGIYIFSAEASCSK
jgi:hypothetical protein